MTDYILSGVDMFDSFDVELDVDKLASCIKEKLFFARQRRGKYCRRCFNGRAHPNGVSCKHRRLIHDRGKTPQVFVLGDDSLTFVECKELFERLGRTARAK